MSANYYTYHIHVPDSQLVRVTKFDPDNQRPTEATGKFRSDRLTDKIKELIKIIRDAPRTEQLKDSEKVRSLGEALFDVLFDIELSQDFLAFYRRVVEQQQSIMRVELKINEEGIPDIAALPWEFMCVPKRYNAGNIWLATDPKLIFLRRPQAQASRTQPVQIGQHEKLRIALVISAPSDAGDVQSYQVQKTLSDLSERLANKIQLLPVVNPATPKKINALLADEPHIFHFIGHGRLNNTNNREVGEIAFVDEYSEADWRSADFFSGLFNRHRPKVVLLQVCEGAKQSESEAFISVASSLVNQNVPVVVAMQYEVSNNTASSFACSVYEQIAQGKPIDIAVQEGRHDITLSKLEHQTRDFATPVIFMCVPDGYLFQPQENIVYSQKSDTLGGSQRQQFCEALMDAFRSETDLEIMLIYELYWKLNQMAGGNNYRQIVFSLIDKAEAQGQLRQLLESAKKANPLNPKLRNFYL